jgi:cellulose biosynthesis protein BcsQ
VKTLACYSIKGGVGKTSAAVNLAYEAASAGGRVLVWDLDPQAASSYLLRTQPVVKGGAGRLVGPKGQLDRHIRATQFESIDVMPADFSLRHLDIHLDEFDKPSKRLRRLVRGVDDRYDVVIIDCPPSISLASESMFGAVDALLVPTTPTQLSLRTVVQLTGFLADLPHRPTLMPFVSMFDRRRPLQRELVEILTRDLPALLPTAIPNSAVVERMSAERSPIGHFAPRSAAAAAYCSLWKDVNERLWN